MKCIISVVVLVAATALVVADDKKADSRTTVERYVTAALGGKVEDAIGLAVAGQGPSRKEKIEQFKALIAAKAVKLPTVWADEKTGRAVAISEQVKLTKAQPSGENRGILVIALVKVDGKWQVKDVDFRTKDAGQEQVDKFKKKNLNAKEVPVPKEA